jgi:hypothetical protein
MVAADCEDQGIVHAVAGVLIARRQLVLAGFFGLVCREVATLSLKVMVNCRSVWGSGCACNRTGIEESQCGAWT